MFLHYECKFQTLDLAFKALYKLLSIELSSFLCYHPQHELCVPCRLACSLTALRMALLSWGWRPLF